MRIAEQPRQVHLRAFCRKLQDASRFAGLQRTGNAREAGNAPPGLHPQSRYARTRRKRRGARQVTGPVEVGVEEAALRRKLTEQMAHLLVERERTGHARQRREFQEIGREYAVGRLPGRTLDRQAQARRLDLRPLRLPELQRARRDLEPVRRVPPGQPSMQAG